MTNISDDGVNGKTCPAGWDLFHNNCFIYVNEPLIWDDAKARCQAMSEFDMCFIEVKLKRDDMEMVCFFYFVCINVPLNLYGAKARGVKRLVSLINTLSNIWVYLLT